AHRDDPGPVAAAAAGECLQARRRAQPRRGANRDRRPSRRRSVAHRDPQHWLCARKRFDRRRWDAQLPRAPGGAVRRCRETRTDAAAPWSRSVRDAALAGSPRMMRVIVADDEAPARGKLQRWLSEQSDIEVIAESDDGLSAAAAIERLKPD